MKIQTRSGFRRRTALTLTIPAAVVLITCGVTQENTSETLPAEEGASVTIDRSLGTDAPGVVGAWIDATGTVSTASTDEGRTDVAFQVGSISKYVCTLAVMDMVQDGALDLDTPIDTLLPDYFGGSDGRITLAHLLQNRSGLEDGISHAFRNDPAFLTTPRTTIEAANLYGSGEPTFEPGDRFDYALSNWVVVQAVLEAADGRSLPFILQNRIFNPADMTDARVVIGPFDGPDDAKANSGFPPLPSFIGCAGGIAMSAADLARLVRFPYDTSDFTDETVETLTRISTEDEMYALGGRILERDWNDTAHRISWQDGSNGPYKARAAYDPVSKTGFSVATATGNGEGLEAALDSWLEGLQP
ncbi:MAG: serine hydrolase domain-containing protein [Pseudomonadota bacterium]